MTLEWQVIKKLLTMMTLGRRAIKELQLIGGNSMACNEETLISDNKMARNEGTPTYSDNRMACNEETLTYR